MENETDISLITFINDLIIDHMNAVFESLIRYKIRSQYLSDIDIEQYPYTNITAAKLKSLQSEIFKLIEMFDQATKDITPHTVKPFWDIYARPSLKAFLDAIKEKHSQDT